MQTDSKVVLFEQTPIPKAVAQLAVPTVLSSLVMVSTTSLTPFLSAC